MKWFLVLTPKTKVVTELCFHPCSSSTFTCAPERIQAGKCLHEIKGRWHVTGAPGSLSFCRDEHWGWYSVQSLSFHLRTSTTMTKHTCGRKTTAFICATKTGFRDKVTLRNGHPCLASCSVWAPPQLTPTAENL